MTEQILVLQPDSEGRVIVVGPGHAPIGRQLENLDTTHPPLAIPSIPTKLWSTTEWLTRATDALVRCLCDKKAEVAAPWFAQPLSISPDAWNARIDASAAAYKANLDEVRRRTAEGGGEQLLNALAESQVACQAYADDLMTLLHLCTMRVQNTLAACETASTLESSGEEELHDVYRQLIEASGVKISGACESEWRARIREIVEEEYALAKERHARILKETVTHASAQIPVGEMTTPKDPSAQFRHSPLIAHAIRAYARQVELIATAELVKCANSCAMSMQHTR